MWEIIKNNLDVVSLTCTVISGALTFVSIVLTIITWIFKKKTVFLYNTIDLKSVIALFDSESSRFKNRTRSPEWYKGVDPNDVIDPFSDILSKFPSIYSSIKCPAELKGHVDKLNEIIIDYSSVSSETKREATSHISSISEILHDSLQQKVKRV